MKQKRKKRKRNKQNRKKQTMEKKRKKERNRRKLEIGLTREINKQPAKNYSKIEFSPVVEIEMPITGKISYRRLLT